MSPGKPPYTSWPETKRSRLEFREVLDVLPSIHPESEAVLGLDPGQKLELGSGRLVLQCPENRVSLINLKVLV